MTKRKRIWMNVLLVVIVITASLLILNMTYQAGRDKGRSETVTMIQELADNYEFRMRDNDGWMLGSAKGGEFFPNYDGSTLMHEYDSDDGRIHLSYEK